MLKIVCVCVLPGEMKSYFLAPVFLFQFLSLPLVFCQLSPNQTASMTTLATMLNRTASSWNPDRNPCSWMGVNCSSDKSSVTALSLSGFALSNSDFLPVVCKIESLLSLDLSNNHLSSVPPGFFTACGGIDGLKLLNFSRNRIAGSLPTFVGFAGLESLDMSYNALTGNISVQLDGLVALKSLNLTFNHFTGSIPTNLGKSLEELQLSVSGFQGVIPPEIGSYQSLSLLDLSGNRLSGSIPGTLGNLSKLKILILSDNKLSDEIPANISSIPTLYRFVANQNQFSGAIPSGITRYLSFLDLSYNKLRGSIPSDLLSSSGLVFVDLSYNMLDGAIPETMSTSLVRLRLGSNLLSGSIPSPFPTLRNLMYLELDNNSLSGTIPTGLSVCQSLALLNLAQNKLTGPVPESLGNLSNLEVLKLQLNSLGGDIPVQITRLSKLSLMNISWNSLGGAIPPSISNLQALSHLDLQGNNLSGVIPDTIGTMNSLLELQLGENQLSGPIPELPLKLQIALNLSSNLFGGSIPSTLSRLMDLEVLDLSSNKLTGGIPVFLTKMGSLTQLILSNNQLSGVVPVFGSYVSLNVTGNAGLIFIKRPNTRPGSVGKKKPVALEVILSVVGAALVAGLALFVVLLLSRRFLKVNDHESQPEEELPQVIIQGHFLTVNRIHRSNIDFSKAMEAVTDPLNISLKTRFCTYYKATMPSGASYFVKKLNWSDKLFQLGCQDRFGQELEVLGSFNNSNVMTPLAYVLTVDSAYLFYEYAHKGTLFHVLHGKLGDSLDWASRYSIAVGVAHGLTSLHGYASGPILLLDLSSMNILLKTVKEPQVGDIELCKVIDPTKSAGSLSTVAGSVGYIPPEYAYTMRVTMAGNVYSFGVILLELLTGKPAVSEGTELAKWVLSNSMQQHRLDRILDSSISRASISVRGQMLALLKVAISCVSVSPEARPKMKSVLRMILNAR